jgi:hypothetical protein
VTGAAVRAGAQSRISLMAPAPAPGEDVGAALRVALLPLETRGYGTGSLAALCAYSRSVTGGAGKGVQRAHNGIFGGSISAFMHARFAVHGAQMRTVA